MGRRVPGFVRALVAFVALVVGIVAGPHRAHAWVELTVSNDDVRVSIDPAGKARVEHRVTLLVSGGPLKVVTLKGVDGDATVLPDGYVVLEKDASKKGLDGATPVTAKRIKAAATGSDPNPDRTDLEVSLGEGIKRGAYVLFIRYETDLRANGGLTDDGATALVKWTGPSWDDGLDATKAVFELPAAPTEPKVPADDEAAEALDVGTVLSTVHRDGKNDVIELARPYAAKGERVVWTLRVDARAFGRGAAAKERAPTAPSPHGLYTRVVGNPRDSLVLGLALGLFALVSLLVAAKTLEVRRLARERGGSETPLVPLPLLVRAPLAGLALVGGLFVQMTHQSSLPGASLVAVAALLAAHRAPRHKAALRGPGQWLPVSVSEALRSEATPPRAHLDASTWTGRFVFVALVGAVAAGSVLLWPISRYYAVLVALDATPLLAIFFTGRLDQLLPDLTVAPIAFFRKVVKKVERGLPEVRVVPRVRIPQGSADADELRIALLPPRPVRGLFAIELGVSYAPGIGGYTMQPELLIRYSAGTEAETRAVALARHGRAQRGRKPDERVLSVSPKLPTARMTADLAVALLSAMVAPERASVAPQDEPAKTSPRARRSLAA